LHDDVEQDIEEGIDEDSAFFLFLYLSSTLLPLRTSSCCLALSGDRCTLL